MKRIGVIDLGSNTFHLLIVEGMSKQSFKTVYRSRVFIGLSDGGIDVIKEDRIEDGLRTLADFKAKLLEYGVLETKVVGTAVLRKASNRQVFISRAKETLDTDIQIIDGLAEADYIFKGIMLLPGLDEGIHLIMDVGGGSTEFILIENGEKIWSDSYTLGVGVLHQLFHHNEPISAEDLADMKTHVLQVIGPMINAIGDKKLHYLIGASGSFEVLQSMTGRDPNVLQMDEINLIESENVYQTLVSATYEQRLKIEGLPNERAKLIVVGVALKKIIVDVLKPEKILISPYALKEGILSEMLD
jgi:exopolyphosphatase / guanosine-5'-triphosphate,3'-diphosphate pyrophosphatase